MFVINKSHFKYILPAIPPALWGTGVGIAKYLLSSDSIDSATLVYSRFLFTAMLMLPLMIFLLLKQHKKNRSSSSAITTHSVSHNLFMKNKALIGLSFIIAITLSGVVLNNYIFYLGLGLTLASDSALIVGFSPIISIVLANLLIRKPFQRNQIIGSIFGLGGVAIIIGLQLFNLNMNRLLGDLIVFCGITLWSGSFIFSKKASESGYSPIAITFYSIVIGVLCMTPIIIILKDYREIIYLVTTNYNFLLAMLFYGLLSGAIGYSIWYGTINNLGPVETAIFLDSLPFWTLVFSVLFLHEVLTIYHIFGLILISIGVVVVNKTDLLNKG